MSRRRNQNFEKPANLKKSLMRLAQFCRPYALIVFIAMAADMISVILRLQGPDRLRDITNTISKGLTGTIDMDSVLHTITILIVLYVAGALLSFVTGIIMTVVTQKVNKSLRSDISEKINRLPVGYFQSTSIGDVLSRMTNDVDLIGTTIQSSISSLISAITMLIGSVFMMFHTSWILALVAIASSLLGFVFMGVIMSKSQKYFQARQKWLGRLDGHVEEMYSGHNIVQLYNANEKEKIKFEHLNEELRQANWKSQFLSGMMQPLMNFVGNLGYVAVCVTGAALTIEGKMDFGTIVAFMIYIRQFTNPLSQLGQAATNFQSAGAASERVFEFLDEPEMADDSQVPARLQDVKGEVDFEDVKFSYVPGKEIIHGFSESVHPGQKVAIVGHTGAGKTTMVNLLMKFYEPDSGQILIDGIPTSTMSRAEVHRQFGMVLQDTWLFEGTVRENLSYGLDHVSDEQLTRAMDAAGLHHFLATLPHGLDTVLDEGSSLSAGQKQLLTIARAMVQNAPMLILDEATSSVDTRTEALIQQAMDELTKGRTSFVIAHRLSTIRNADKILVMEDGDVVESGTHDQLLAKGGSYAALYNSQFVQGNEI